MKELNLQAEFTVNGNWWLPEKPSVKLPGTLSNDGSSGARLKLFGLLEGVSSGSAEGLRRCPIMLGVTDEGDPCTLYETVITLGLPQANEEIPVITEVYPTRVFFGKHFQTTSDVRFTSMQIRYTNLEEWLGIFPFSISLPPDGTVFKVDSTKLTEKRVDLVDPGRPATLSIGSVVKHSFGLKRISAEHDVYLQVRPPAASTFEWYYDLIFDARNLFTLFVGSPVYVEMMTGFGDEIDYGAGAKYPEEIGIYFSTIPWPKKEPLRLFEMSVPFELIKERWDDVFRLWFTNARKLRLVCELFFGSLFNSEMYEESKFLNFTQALEAFQRVMMKEDCYVAKEDYEQYRKAIVQAIPKGIPPRLKEKLQTMLAYGNEYSLKERLNHLFCELDASTREMIETDVDSLIKRVVATRNYLTHGDEKLKAGALRGPNEYFEVNRKLRAILSIHLLKMIGVPEPQVAARVFRRW